MTSTFTEMDVATTEALDISDPLWSTAANAIKTQIVGYKTAGPSMIGADQYIKDGFIWTERTNELKPELEAIKGFYSALMYNQATGVNGTAVHSDVVGWASSIPGESHAALFGHFGYTLLIGLNAASGQLQGPPLGEARSVSNRDGLLMYIAGWSMDGGIRRPVRWTIDLNTPRPPHTIYPLASEGEALRIHDDGSIVGWFRASDGNPHAYLWTPGGPGPIPPNPQFRDLGTLGGTRSVAYGVAGGIVVGASDTSSGESRAFAWYPPGYAGITSPAHMRELAAQESAASDINEAGVIVGWAKHPGGNPRATLWDRTGQRDLQSDLPRPTGWTLSRANAINDRNQICGIGNDATGTDRAWLAYYDDRDWLSEYVGAMSRVTDPRIYVDLGRILGQVGFDGPGVKLGPGGRPEPVPPRNPAAIVRSPAARQILLATIVSELALALEDPRARTAVRRASLEFLQRLAQEGLKEIEGEK